MDVYADRRRARASVGTTGASLPRRSCIQRLQIVVASEHFCRRCDWPTVEVKKHSDRSAKASQ